MISRPLVVLPTFNEAGNIGAIVEDVGRILPGSTMVVVDDASPDGTADVAEAIGAQIGADRVFVLRRSSKGGLGSAYKAGFRWGLDRGHDALIQMDSDFQHDPRSLPDLIAALDGGADMAIGSRYVAGGSLPANWGWHRRALSRGGTVTQASCSACPCTTPQRASARYGRPCSGASISMPSAPTATGFRSSSPTRRVVPEALSLKCPSSSVNERSVTRRCPVASSSKLW